MRLIWCALLCTVSALAQSLPLTELAALLGQCALFVGHDSGISHLAAAVGLPGLILWGETAEEIWRPPSEKMTVLRHPGGLAKLPLSQVMKELAKIGEAAMAPGLR